MEYPRLDRFTQSRIAGVRDRKFSDADPHEQEHLAMYAELRVAYPFGMCEQVFLNRPSEIDFHTPDGFTNEAKSTPNGRCLMKPNTGSRGSGKRPDILTLILGPDPDHFTFGGWCWGRDLIQPGNYFKVGQHYAVTKQEAWVLEPHRLNHDYGAMVRLMVAHGATVVDPIVPSGWWKPYEERVLGARPREVSK